MLAEAAGRLAGGEAEDRGADQAFGPGDLGLGQAAFTQRRLYRVADRAAAGVTAGLVSSSGKTAGCLRAVSLIPALGAALDWHGALSADVIDGPAGPVFIDINPRLVEPVNALESGVDLVRALVEVARADTSRPQPPGRPGVRTHQWGLPG